MIISVLLFWICRLGSQFFSFFRTFETLGRSTSLEVLLCKMNFATVAFEVSSDRLRSSAALRSMPYWLGSLIVLFWNESCGTNTPKKLAIASPFFGTFNDCWVCRCSPVTLTSLLSITWGQFANRLRSGKVCPKIKSVKAGKLCRL